MRVLIVDDEELIGTMSFHSLDRGRFSLATQADIQELAERCALLLKNAQIHQRQMALREARQIAASEIIEDVETVTLHSTANKVTQAFTSVFSIMDASLWLFDEDKMELHCVQVTPAKTGTGTKGFALLQDAVARVGDPVLHFAEPARPESLTLEGLSILNYEAACRKFERSYWTGVLEHANGIKAQAARHAGLHRTTLYEKLSACGLHELESARPQD